MWYSKGLPKLDIGPHDFEEKGAIAPATVLERLYLYGLLSMLPAVVAKWCVEWALSSDPETKKTTLRRHLITNVPMFVVRNITVEQLRLILPLVPLRKEMQHKLLQDTLEGLHNYNGMFDVEGASARWINEVPDRTPEDPVIVYLHGGAFFLKVVWFQIAWNIALAKKLNARGRRLSILAVDYSVTPYKRFPTQLDQSLAVYRELSKSCQKIILLGDSAGGNLSAGILAKIAEQDLQKAWAAVLVSPWMALAHRQMGSYVDHNDYLEIEDRYWRMYCHPEDLANPIVNPIVGSGEYWVPKLPERTICVYGERELLKDSIIEWNNKAKVPIVYEEPRGVHDVVVLGPHFKASKVVFKQIDEWLAPPGDTQAPLPGPDRPKL